MDSANLSIESLESKKPKQPHLGYLDGMRGLAALYVFLHHANFMIWPDSEKTVRPTGWIGWISSAMLLGHYSVDIFIVLSGFCLMLPVIRSGSLRGGGGAFLVRRARRILPPYYACVALSLLLVWTIIPAKTGSHWDNSVPISVGGVISHLLLLQDVYTPTKEFITQLNYSLWSVATEFHIYLIFPLLVWFWGRVGGLLTIGLTFLMGYGALAALHGLPIRVICVHYVALFGLGMGGCAIVFDSKPLWSTLRLRVPWLLVTLLAVAIVVPLSRHAGWHNLSPLVLDYPVAIAFTALLIYIGRSDSSRLRNVFQWKPLEFVGVFSYSLYLIHAPLLQVIWQYILQPMRLSKPADFLFLSTAGTVSICVISFGFYLAFERPFMSSNQRSALPKEMPIFARA